MIKSLHIENFTVFGDATFAFSPGINVLLGANGTGKTHVLKLLYCIESYLAHARSQALRVYPPHFRRVALMGSKLNAVFRPDDGEITRLVRRSKPDSVTKVKAGFDEGIFSLDIDSRQMKHLPNASDSRDFEHPSKAIFLPAREVLSIFPGFISAYTDRELSFDETYYDLCIALDRLPLRGPRGEEAATLRQPLSDAIQATVQREGSRFYVTSEVDGKVEAHLVAEGLRKIASVMHLIANGSIAKGTILFWDEPESNLNPKLIKVVADFLLTLAGQGVQVFIATHDYLLTNEISLQSEYQTPLAQQAPIQFFLFERGEDGVSVQSSGTLGGLNNNPIMQEFEALYQRERRLFIDASRRKQPAGADA